MTSNATAAQNGGVYFLFRRTASWRGWVVLLPLTLLLAALALLLQWMANGYVAELLNDEASHYISGLLIHDYLRTGLMSNPVAFLKTFYSAYPLVGIGHWPPLFYGVEAAWMLLFSTGKTAMMLLSASITTAVAVAVLVQVRNGWEGRGATLAGLCCGLAFVLSPIVQDGTSELMLDVAVAGLCFLAMSVYAAWLESGRVRHAIWFGVIAAAAMLVKGNSACLALLPPFVVLVNRRFDLLRRGSFWLPLPVVAVLSGPWYTLTFGRTEAGFRFEYGLRYMAQASVTNTEFLLEGVGAVVLAAALLGLCVVVARPGRAGAMLVAAAALCLSVAVFQVVMPAGLQKRYMVPLLPPLLLLAAFGVRWLAAALRLRPSVSMTAMLVLLLSVAGHAVLGMPSKPVLGLPQAARQVWDHRSDANPVVLLATDLSVENAAIVELAMTDPARPSLFAIRASRLLGGGGYNTDEYAPRFSTPQQVMAEIDAYAIPLVLFRAHRVDSRPGLNQRDMDHIGQVEQARQLYPERWELLYRDAHASPEILLYRIRGNDSRPADVARIRALTAPRGL